MQMGSMSESGEEWKVGVGGRWKDISYARMSNFRCTLKTSDLIL